MLMLLLKRLYARNLVIQDETPTGSILHQFKIRLSKKHLTVKELIRERVFQEIEDYNYHRSGCFHGLVPPDFAEPVLNGYRLHKWDRIDPEKQFGLAMDIFMNKGFCILVDEERLEDPDQPIEVQARTRVSFLRLRPVA